jgi:hypothetical protein
MQMTYSYSRNIWDVGKWAANSFYATKVGIPYLSVIARLYSRMVCTAAVWEPIKDWRELYLSALVEIDPAKLKHKAEMALLAVHQRTQELNSVSGHASFRATIAA